MMTLSMAMATTASVPGRTGSQNAARAPHQVRRGSTEMIFDPIWTHWTSQWPRKPSALDLMGSLPHTSTTPGTCQFSLA